MSKPEYLDRARHLLAAISQGSWYTHRRDDGATEVRTGSSLLRPGQSRLVAEVRKPLDAELIAQAPRYLAAMLDRMERLEAQEVADRERIATQAQEYADLEEQATRARTALEAITHERNAWARQQADLRDELNTALMLADDERTKRAGAENDRAAADVEAEDATTERDAMAARLAQSEAMLRDAQDLLQDARFSLNDPGLARTWGRQRRTVLDYRTIVNAPHQENGPTP